MAYDKHAHAIIVFGGRGSKKAYGDMNDMWEFNIEEQFWKLVKSEQSVKDPTQALTLKSIMQMSSVVTTFKKAGNRKSSIKQKNQRPSFMDPQADNEKSAASLP